MALQVESFSSVITTEPRPARCGLAEQGTARWEEEEKDRFHEREAPEAPTGIVVTMLWSATVYSRRKDRCSGRERGNRGGGGGRARPAACCHNWTRLCSAAILVFRTGRHIPCFMALSSWTHHISRGLARREDEKQITRERERARRKLKLCSGCWMLISFFLFVAHGKDFLLTLSCCCWMQVSRDAESCQEPSATPSLTSPRTRLLFLLLSLEIIVWYSIGAFAANWSLLFHFYFNSVLKEQKLTQWHNHRNRIICHAFVFFCFFW